MSEGIGKLVLNKTFNILFSMGFIKYSIGIDISKDYFNCAIILIDDQQTATVKSSSKFANTASGFKQFIDWANKHCKQEVPFFFVMEATGIYYEQLAWYLFSKDFNVSVVLPTKAKNYIRSTGLKSKNDKIDAKGLALMGAQQQLRLWKPLSQKIYELRTLTRFLEDLNGQLTSIRNQKHALSHSMYKLKEVMDIQTKTILHLEKQIAKVRAAIEEVIIKDPALKAKYALVKNLKGIGITTFAVIVAETNGFELFTNQRQLISFCGYDPIENQSGKHTGRTKISKKGNSHVRRILFLPSFTAVRRKGGDVFTSLYNRLIKNGKSKMQAYVAVQKKMLTIIYTLWKTDKPFDSQYAKTKDQTRKLHSEQPNMQNIENVGEKEEKRVVQELARTTQGRYTKKELWDTAFSGFENTSKNPN
jgi:transposase